MTHNSIADTTHLPDFLGETLNGGRLEIIECLGFGTYGVVYKAFDTTSPADSPIYYAVKCLPKIPVGTPEAIFQARELKLHKMVGRHSNVVTMHWHFSEQKCLFFVLDFCAGGDLFSAITEKRHFQRNTVLVKQAFVQLLDAVQHCHNNKVYHRDLKPENILCDSDGNSVNVWLADFGLATQDKFCDKAKLGSPYYLSPESINPKQNGPWSCRHSDIWSLGVILTNMISGRNPWNLASLEDEFYVSYLSSNDFLLNTLPISKGANNILKRCFQLNPAARPSLSQIRDDVLKLDTFFLSDEELVHASSTQRAIALYYCERAPEDVYSPDANQADTRRDESEAHDSDISSEDSYIYATHPFDLPWLRPPPTLRDSGSISASDVSGPDSSGPPTPATHAVDPVVNVVIPDLTEDANIGVSALSTQVSVPDGSAKPTSRSRNLWKRAMRRIKAMGN
ncbi:serine/threonine protein kinase, negative regulator of sexual conjugation and meiosis [Mycena vitilis]|nr:serine/threonine protein kinase, negative regulator of sexual conjugation and meiosis [Mycena vitilis]